VSPELAGTSRYFRYVLFTREEAQNERSNVPMNRVNDTNMVLVDFAEF
jgi:hypothetical protein